jgi:hypothetical protein
VPDVPGRLARGGHAYGGTAEAAPLAPTTARMSRCLLKSPVGKLAPQWRGHIVRPRRTVANPALESRPRPVRSGRLPNRREFPTALALPRWLQVRLRYETGEWAPEPSADAPSCRAPAEPLRPAGMVQIWYAEAGLYDLIASSVRT